MPSEPAWLTAENAIEFNRLAVAETDEPFFVRDRGLLEGAMASPRNHWHYGEDRIPVLAAFLLLALARDHPFEQGNKRVALLVADAFLLLNGYDLHHPDEGFGDLIIAAVARDIEQWAFVDTFVTAVSPISISPQRKRVRLKHSKRQLHRTSAFKLRQQQRAQRRRGD